MPTTKALHVKGCVARTKGCEESCDHCCQRGNDGMTDAG